MQASVRIALLILALTCGVLLLGAAVAVGGAGDGGTSADPEPAAGETQDPDANAPTPETEPPGPEDAKLRVRLRGGAKVSVGDGAKVIGTLKPYAPHQRVNVLLLKRGKTVAKGTVTVRHDKGRDVGRFTWSKRVIEPGKYRIAAKHKASGRLGEAKGRTVRFKTTYPSLGEGSRGSEVRILNHLLDDLGYVTGSGQTYGARTARAVQAYRTVNRMPRTTDATSSIFRRLAAGRGGFKLRYPEGGKHIEVAIARQVMVLADDGEAKRIYYVSTGAPATPTVRGKYHFYRRWAGYNAKKMYYSSFFIRGYAIHGFKSVPTYPASHGCVRVALSEAISIYDWIDDGMAVYTYS